MLPTSDPDRIDIAFDDDRLVAGGKHAQRQADRGLPEVHEADTEQARAA